MKITKQQLKQIIKEELENLLDESGKYSVDKLPNGLISILNRESGLKGLYNADGTHKSGDLKLPKGKVKELTSK
tara:strand:+ start:1858 stop:2079 length:222 start_codon:yes stop_codon:yes gene_type:complete